MPLTQVIGTEPLKKVEEPEVNDGDFELIQKIRSFAGLGYDPDGEHAYTRQKGQNDLSVPLPTRKLFYTYDTESSSPVQDEDVDIDSVEEEGPLVDTAVANRLLDECEKLIEIYRPRADKQDTEDCWDEMIPKHNWSASHLSAFNHLLRILNQDRLSRLSHAGHSSEAILRRVTIERTAARLRHLLASGLAWNVKQAQWLHGVLVTWAPVKVLVSYLEAMQVLYAKIPSLVNQVINTSPVSLASKNLGLDIITQIVTKKCWDPVAPMLAQHKMPKLPVTPVFIVLGSEPLHDLPQNSRTHHWIRLLTELGTVIPITTLQTDQDKSRMKIATYLDELLYTVRYRIHAAKSEFSDPSKRPLILVGLNAGSALMAHAALYEASVAGVVCLGFSVQTAEGRRGRPGDRLLELKVPTLFAIGGCATTSSEREVEELRGKMQCISGLIVVGGADDQLRKNKLDLIRERVTQDIVDRAVINETAAFLSKSLTMPKPSLPPKPTPVASGDAEIKVKEPKPSKRETKEKERVKKNYYQEKKRKLAEMMANSGGSTESSPKKQKRDTSTGKNPQIIMVSTAPTILRTSTANQGKQISKIKKSDISPRKSLEDQTSQPPLTTSPTSVPQITIVPKPPKLHSTSSASNVPITSSTTSSLSRALHKVLPNVNVKVPSNTSIVPSTSVRIPASTSILPVSSVRNVPASTTIIPVTKTGPAHLTSAASSSSVASVATTESNTTGGVISLQSLLKSHQAVKPVPLSQTKKKSSNMTSAATVLSNVQTPPNSAVISTGTGTTRNIKVIDGRTRTFNISSLSNVRYLTSSPVTPNTTTTLSSSQPNLLRDLTPAQLLDAPIDIMAAPVEILDSDVTEVIPLTRGMPVVSRTTLSASVAHRTGAGSTLTPVVARSPVSASRQSVKLIRINKSGINVTSPSTPKGITRLLGPSLPNK